MQTLFTRMELAERWNCTTKHIEHMELAGKLTRHPDWDRPKYPLKQVEALDWSNGGGKTLREKQLEDEVKSKDKMIGELMAHISKIQTIALGGETKE